MRAWFDGSGLKSLKGQTSSRFHTSCFTTTEVSTSREINVSLLASELLLHWNSRTFPLLMPIPIVWVGTGDKYARRNQKSSFTPDAAAGYGCTIWVQLKNTVSPKFPACSHRPHRTTFLSDFGDVLIFEPHIRSLSTVYWTPPTWFGQAYRIIAETDWDINQCRNPLLYYTNAAKQILHFLSFHEGKLFQISLIRL